MTGKYAITVLRKGYDLPDLFIVTADNEHEACGFIPKLLGDNYLRSLSFRPHATADAPLSWIDPLGVLTPGRSPIYVDTKNPFLLTIGRDGLRIPV